MKLALDSQMRKEGLLHDPDPVAAQRNWVQQRGGKV
jgi:hypothetical protein